MPKPDAHERVEVQSRAELRQWLRDHHGQTDSIWLVRYKKHCPDIYVSMDEVIDEALCWGWIDSLPRKLDEDRTMVRLSPRKPDSAWSKINKDKVENLIADGLMQPAGLTKIDRAKANGMWDFLNDVDALISPDDLVRALKTTPSAEENFNAFPHSAKRGILEWIKQAKSPETRGKRISETARLAALNVRANSPAARGK